MSKVYRPSKSAVDRRNRKIQASNSIFAINEWLSGKQIRILKDFMYDYIEGQLDDIDYCIERGKDWRRPDELIHELQTSTDYTADVFGDISSSSAECIIEFLEDAPVSLIKPLFMEQWENVVEDDFANTEYYDELISAK